MWWGVLVLDRFIHLGLEKRPFACEDARPEDLLPMEDRTWELGVRLHSFRNLLYWYARSHLEPQEQSVISSLAVSGDTTLPAPAFARTCQASHLLSRVLAHIYCGPSPTNAAQYYSQSFLLHQVLSSFHEALGQELQTEDLSTFMALSTAMGICISATIALYDAHSCADLDDPSGVGIPEQLKIQGVALSGLHEIGASVCEFASRISVAVTSSTSCAAMLSPFVCEAFYAAAKQFLWYIRETGKLELLATVNILTEALQLLGQRWHVASKCI